MISFGGIFLFESPLTRAAPAARGRGVGPPGAGLFRAGLLSAVVSMGLTGCALMPTPEQTGQDVVEQTAEQDVSRPPVAEEVPPATLAPSYVSLRPQTPLATLAKDLDGVAISRSSAVQEVQAAQAELRARRFDLYPQIVPTASAPLSGGGDASLGLSVEQMIWDGGRVRGRLTDAELKIANARLRAWRDRNETVSDGLRAYVELSRFEARLAAYASLRQALDDLADLLETRAAGGVADRGELLRMNVALQEVQRDVVTNMSDLRQARADLMRLLPPEARVTPLTNLEAAASQCQRAWPDTEAPQIALARVALARAEASKEITRAQRFPRVVLGAGSSYSQGGLSEPSVGIRLDASDFLGLGGRNTIEAANASVRAAEASYTLQQDETRSDLASIEEDYEGLRSDISLLRALQSQNEASLELYEEQLDAGSIPLTEGITLHREKADTRIAIIDVQADILLNCLRSSELRGILAPFGELEETH